MIEKGKTAILYVVGFSLCAYLIASLTHVEWVFRLFEPHTAITWNLLLFQVDARDVEAFSQAIGIDVLTSLLIAFCILSEKKAYTAIMVVIIATLIVYSFLFNFVYAEANSPVGVTNLWNVPLLFGLTTIGAVIPLMVSAYPLFILAYTFIAIFIRGVKEVSVEDLRRKADLIEDMQREKDRITEAKRSARLNRINGLIDTASAIRDHTRASLSRKVSQEEPEQEEPASLELTEAPALLPEPVQAPAPLPVMLEPVEIIETGPITPVPSLTGNGHQFQTPVETQTALSEWDSLPVIRRNR